jgi:hypothetical protein
MKSSSKFFRNASIDGGEVTLWVRGVVAGSGVVQRMSVAPQERRSIAGICPVVKGRELTFPSVGRLHQTDQLV